MYIFSESWDLALFENLARFCIFCEQVRILTNMRPSGVLGKTDFLKNRSKFFFWDPIKDRTKRFLEVQTYQKPVVNRKNRFINRFFGFYPKSEQNPQIKMVKKCKNSIFPKYSRYRILMQNGFRTPRGPISGHISSFWPIWPIFWKIEFLVKIIFLMVFNVSQGGAAYGRVGRKMSSGASKCLLWFPKILPHTIDVM